MKGELAIRFENFLLLLLSERNFSKKFSFYSLKQEEDFLIFFFCSKEVWFRIMKAVYNSLFENKRIIGIYSFPLLLVYFFFFLSKKKKVKIIIFFSFSEGGNVVSMIFSSFSSCQKKRKENNILLLLLWEGGGSLFSSKLSSSSCKNKKIKTLFFFPSLRGVLYF